MQISALNIQNFRNHKNTTIMLDKLNIFVGRNNSGKSSILAAIEWALTGRNLWTDKAGRGAQDLITQGEKFCQVTVELKGAGHIVRTLPPHQLAAGKYAGMKEAQAYIFNALETDEQTLQLLLNAGAFMTMPPAEQKAFLFRLCGISFSPEAIQEAVLKLTGNQEAAKRAIGLMPGKLDGDALILEGMEKRAREARKEAKKELERVKAALAEMELPNLPDGIGLEDKEEVVRQLKELEKERDRLIKLAGESQAIARNKEYLQNKYTSLVQKIKLLEDEKERKKALVAGTDRKKAEQELAKAKKEAEQLSDMIRVIEIEIATRSQEAGSKTAIIGQLQNFAGKCPLAPDTISCPLQEKDIEAIIARLREESAEAEKKAETYIQDKNKLLQQKEAIQNKITELEKKIADLAKTENELPMIDMEIERVQKELDGTRTELVGLKAAREVDPEELSGLEERIEKGREILRKLDLAEHGRKQAGQLQADLQALEKEVEILEALVKALGPDGIRKTLFGSQLKDFTSQLNDQLNLITEGQYQLDWDGDFAPLVRQSGSLLPPRLLSKSEQFRVGIALQIAIAKLAGLRFLAIDEVDMLDQVNRGLLTWTLIDQVDEFDQIMMFCTIGEVEPQNPGLPGVKMFWVEDGNVEEL